MLPERDRDGFGADAERPTTFSGVSGTGGTVMNGIVKIVGEWKISSKKFVVEGVPQGWSMKQTLTGLKLGFDRGTLLIVR